MTDHLWLHLSRPRPTWYEADEAARGELERTWTDVAADSISRGAQRLGSWSVRGQHDYSMVEVWLFKELSEIVTHWDRLVATEYPEWFSTSNTLGAAIPQSTGVALGPGAPAPNSSPDEQEPSNDLS